MQNFAVKNSFHLCILVLVFEKECWELLHTPNKISNIWINKDKNFTHCSLSFFFLHQHLFLTYFFLVFSTFISFLIFLLLSCKTTFFFFFISFWNELDIRPLLWHLHACQSLENHVCTYNHFNYLVIFICYYHLFSFSSIFTGYWEEKELTEIDTLFQSFAQSHICKWLHSISQSSHSMCTPANHITLHLLTYLLLGGWSSLA